MTVVIPGGRSVFRNVRYGVAAVAISTAIAVAGCSSGGGAATSSGSTGGGLQIKMTDMKFEPTQIKAKVGQAVKLQLQNAGAVTHDLTIDDPKVQVIVEPGKSGNAEFTPAKAGTYKVYCSQPGHEASGMVAQLVVE